MNGQEVQPLIGVVMSKKFMRYDNVALVRCIDTKYVTYLEKYLLIILACYSQSDGSNIYPSINQLAEETGLSRTSVKDTLKSLKKKNLIILTNKPLSGSRAPNTYSLNLLLVKQYQISGSLDDHDTHLSGSPHDLDNYTAGRHTTLTGSPHDPLAGRHTTPKKVMLNNKENVTYAREEESAKIGEPVQEPPTKPIQEPKMRDLDNPWRAELKERGLTPRQIDECLDIEKTRGGYIRTNVSYFGDQIKKYPEKNTPRMFFSCIRDNWGRWGMKPEKTVSAPPDVHPMQGLPFPSGIVELPKVNPDSDAYRTARAEILRSLNLAHLSQPKAKSLYLTPMASNDGETSKLSAEQ